MKKTLLLVAVLFSFLALPLAAGAGAATAPSTVPANIDVMVVMDRIVDWLFSILLATAAIAIVVAAYYFVTAQGDPERVGKARNFVLYAMVGVLVAFMARGLVALVQRIAAP